MHDQHAHILVVKTEYELVDVTYGMAHDALYFKERYSEPPGSVHLLADNLHAIMTVRATVKMALPGSSMPSILVFSFRKSTPYLKKKGTVTFTTC